MSSTRRGKHIAWMAAAAGVAVVAAGLIVSKDLLIERWTIWQLESSDRTTRLAALEKLAAIGTHRSIAPLALLSCEGNDEELSNLAAEILGKIFARVGDPAKVQIAQALLGAAEGQSKNPEIFLKSVAAWQAPIVFSVLADAVRSGSPRARTIASIALAEAWPASRETMGETLTTAGPQKAACFYEAIFTGTSFWDLDLVWSRSQEIAAHFAREHPDPSVRAISMSFAVRDEQGGGGGSGNQVSNFELLGEVFAKDSSALVKTAALRIAGVAGPRLENINLQEVISQEKNPIILQAAIQARSLWVQNSLSMDGFMLFDGLPCTWIRGFKEGGGYLNDQEVALLAKILAEEKDQQLRDSASLALGIHRKPETSISPALKLHEWGVWRDEEATLVTAAGKVLADLPKFVHRSETAAGDLWSARSYAPGIVLKPVIFFYAPEPIALLVQVRFHHGRPWTFFPEPSDYLETTSTEEKERDPKRWSKLDPPWVQAGKDQNGLTGERPVQEEILPSGELRSRYGTVPWIVPNHRKHPTDDNEGSVEFTGMGLEWCGLRVGWGSKLEGEFAPVEDGSWWNALRRVPSTPVALRGDHEKFLFYDGAVDLLSPVLVKWRDASKSALVIRTRAFGEYPKMVPEGESPSKDELARDIAPVPAVLVVRREPNQPARGKLLENLPSQGGPLTVPLDGLDLEGEQLREKLATTLRKEGLTAEETAAFLATWVGDFFEAEGLRVLTVLPRWLYDGMLPLAVYPTPGEVVRVGMIWKECADLGVEVSAPAEETWIPKPVKVTHQPAAFREEPLALSEEFHFGIERDGQVWDFFPRGEPIRLSGDGTKVLFRFQSSRGSISVGDLRTKTARCFARFPEEHWRSCSSCSVSADGSRIAYIRGAGRNVWTDEKGSLVVADLKKNRLIEVLNVNNRIDDPQITGDGKLVACFLGSAESKELAIFDLENGQCRKVKLPELDAWQFLRISGDGSHVGFVAGDIWLLDLEKETLLNLSKGRGSNDFPWLSGDGHRVIFSSDRDRGQSLYLADLDARRLQRISACTPEESLPWISADGKKIHYTVEGVLWLKNLESGEARMVFSSESEKAVRASASDDGRVFLIDRDRREGRESRPFLIKLDEK